MMDQGNWCHREFSGVKLGDQRLNRRFLKVSGDLLNNPLSSIAESSHSWHDAKAAYRLFDNKKLSPSHIREPHQAQTMRRLNESKERLFFAIQDTTTINYTHHPKKKGINKINQNPGFLHPNKGCFLHNTLLLSELGEALGLLDQKCYQHDPSKSRATHKQRPITEKESFRWIESLSRTKSLCKDKRVVTICDRESDIYEFFVEAHKLDAKVLVRAAKNRITANATKKERCTLRTELEKQVIVGNIDIDVPSKNGRAKRQAKLSVRYLTTCFKAPQRSPSAKLEVLPKVELTAIWLSEDIDDNDKLEWILLTNIDINNSHDAIKVGQWYKIRWQIECFHRVLKSGCKVEHCRLESFERLERYLALKSIIAYRLFSLTLLNRTDPNKSCESILADHEWKALYCRVNKTSKIPETPPDCQETIIMLAKLGGFLGRKSDGNPGMTTIWRGWHKLMELSELWLAMTAQTCG